MDSLNPFLSHFLQCMARRQESKEDIYLFSTMTALQILDMHVERHNMQFQIFSIIDNVNFLLK